jgi:hypothetical protein
MYDFIDVGCSNGGSLAWGSRVLGGKGLGIDIDPKKVQKAKDSGQDAVLANARQLSFDNESFRYALFFDMLEHLPDQKMAGECLREVYRVVRDLIVITGPNFDNEDYLNGHGLKRYYVDWRGHTWPHTTRDFAVLMKELAPRKFVLCSYNAIATSEHHDILPITAAIDQPRYDPGLHARKPTIAFDRKIYSRILLVIAKSPSINVHEVAMRVICNRLIQSGED